MTDKDLAKVLAAIKGTEAERLVDEHGWLVWQDRAFWRRDREGEDVDVVVKQRGHASTGEDESDLRPTETHHLGGFALTFAWRVIQSGDLKQLRGCLIRASRCVNL